MSLSKSGSRSESCMQPSENRISGPSNEAKSNKELGALKEFHRIIQNVMRLRKQNGAVYELDDPNDVSQVIHEPERLRRTLSDKYQTLFSSAMLRQPFEVGQISFVKKEEMEDCLEVISQGKGMDADCIPDVILSMPI